MRRVIVHIDKLVLRGVERADAATLSAQIQQQLQQSLAAPGAYTALVASGHRHRIDAGKVVFKPGAGMGAGIAQRVAGQLQARRVS